MPSPIEIIRKLGSSVVSDYQQLREYTDKYHAKGRPPPRLSVALVQSIGLQMMAAVRVMQALDAAHVPLLPKAVSRFIRHAYGAEIHWKADVSPGVTLVHGCGIVISHAATIGSGALLFQNVTLGESVDSETRKVGAPTLGVNVHIGPGATLLGPIVVGDRTKVMAGAVLTHSVPPDSVVRPAESTVSSRSALRGLPTDQT